MQATQNCPIPNPPRVADSPTANLMLSYGSPIVKYSGQRLDHSCRVNCVERTSASDSHMEESDNPATTARFSIRRKGRAAVAD